MPRTLFKSRRTSAPDTETSKVAEAVWAYYEAGRRPSVFESLAPEVQPVGEVTGQPASPEHESTDGNAADDSGPSDLARQVVTSEGQTLEELAEELEALIESIRYGAAT